MRTKNIWISSLLILNTVSLMAVSDYENAEDGLTARWRITDNTPAGATITSETNNTAPMNKTIKFSGARARNAYTIGGKNDEASFKWDNYGEKTLSWNMKFDRPYYLFVSVETSNPDIKYIRYSASPNNGLDPSGQTVQYSLSGTLTNYWISITRNLQDDLQTMLPGTELVSVNGVTIRGDGEIDNLTLGTTTVVFDGEDGTNGDWKIFDNTPAGATITNLMEGSNRVIQLAGARARNAYILGGTTEGIAFSATSWNDTDADVLSWKMKFDRPYYLYVAVRTAEGVRYIRYSGSPVVGYDDTTTAYQISLGADSYDNQWHTITRNIKNDLSAYTTDKILSIDGFIVRGDGKIDDVRLLDVAEDFPGY